MFTIRKNHYDPKPSFIVQLFKFYNRTRAPGESVSTFVAALCQIAEYCEYNETLNDMIRDWLVCGVNHERIQKKFLAKKDLTYEKALEMALAVETAEQGTKDLKSVTGTTLPKDLHYTSPHLLNNQSTSGKRRDNVSVPATGVWISMHPVYANSILLNAVS